MMVYVKYHIQEKHKFIKIKCVKKFFMNIINKKKKKINVNIF